MEISSFSKLSINRDYTVGLMCHYLFSNGSAQYVFLDLNDERSAVLNQALSFCTETSYNICASCNGLLLFSSVRDNSISYNVLNLFSKQLVVLPQPQIARRCIRTGLALNGHHYQVVRIFSIKDVEVCIAGSSSAGAAGGSDILEMEIFSSQTGMWRQYYSMIRLPPELPTLSTNPLFSNGALHWELGGNLLIYYINHGKCMLIKLPNYSEDWSWYSMSYGQCLWESRGHVHYCYSDFRGIHTWILINDHSFSSRPDPNNFKWKLSHSILHKTLMSLNPAIFSHIRQRQSWKPYFVSPCAYDEHLDTLYLRIPGIIVSYDLRAQTLKELCTFTFPDTNFHCCMLFLIVKGDSLVGNGKATSGDGAVVSLPIASAFLRRCNSN
ncbi:conserved hypothetical protein [Ricinus communis]|uniref:F-box protein At3g26010-like beta-propeller domain-containing protein n=1 Tax=Ricinus communis TaxID=3988 RepID=B9RGS7_RICCO|nr:conserved hypothetical protein [Ricinus communis]